VGDRLRTRVRESEGSDPVSIANGTRGAQVIPIGKGRARAAGGIEEAIEASSGGGRVVLLAAGPGLDSQGFQLPGAKDPRGSRCIVVRADHYAADELASRILADQCTTSPPEAPRALLRAWVAHLASEGSRLAVALEEPGKLPLDAAGWLGGLVRASRGALRVILPWRNDPRIWRLIEAMGLETEVVAPPGHPPQIHPPPLAPAPVKLAPAPASFEPELPARRRVGGRRMGLAFFGAGVISLAAVAAVWRGVPGDRTVSGPLGATLPPALEVEAVAKERSPGASVHALEQSRVSFDVRDRPLFQVLSDLSVERGFEVRNRTSDPLSKPVTLRVDGLPLEEALRALLRGYSKSFVYSRGAAGAEAARLQAVIVLPGALDADRPASPGDAASQAATSPATVADEIEEILGAMLAEDVGGRHAAAMESLLALDRSAAARELLYQLDQLEPVGPLAQVRVDDVRERLRAALCASGASEREARTLPVEMGCRPTS